MLMNLFQGAVEAVGAKEPNPSTREQDTAEMDEDTGRRSQPILNAGATGPRFKLCPPVDGLKIIFSRPAGPR